MSRSKPNKSNIPPITTETVKDEQEFEILQEINNSIKVYSSYTIEELKKIILNLKDTDQLDDIPIIEIEINRQLELEHTSTFTIVEPIILPIIITKQNVNINTDIDIINSAKKQFKLRYLRFGKFNSELILLSPDTNRAVILFQYEEQQYQYSVLKGTFI